MKETLFELSKKTLTFPNFQREIVDTTALRDVRWIYSETFIYSSFTPSNLLFLHIKNGNTDRNKKIIIRGEIMNKQHLIALDLDGTLLTDNKIISPRTKNTIAKAKEQGHIVVISTGRPFRASYDYYKELSLNTPIVNFNGAYVHHPLDSSWGTHHSPLELSTAQEIVRACFDFGVKNVYAEVIDDVYVREIDEDKKHIFEFGSPKIFTGDLLNILNDHPTCLLIDAHDEHSAAIRQHLTDMHAEVIDHRKWGAPWPIIEIVKSGLNKAVGLQKISSHYNIPKERIIAFGDEDNDFEMIEFAGHGIAMGNAIPELKSLANHTTLTNEEDGIALYLEEVLGL
jgi:hypothetical protein